MSDIAYIDGEFIPLYKARLSILDRGFLFADGIYEVSAVINQKLIDNKPHLARLERSAREIDLPLPETLERIEDIQKELVARNALNEGLVYLQVTRGAADREFTFPKEVKPTLVMFTQDKQLVDNPSARTGIAVKTLPDIRWARRDIKSIALLGQVLAKQAAAEVGCQEAWMVEDGMITEGASSSAFIVTGDNVIITRPTSSAILPGCTRKALMALAEERQIRIEERAFSVDEALAAKEAFITSASSFVLPVVTIDGVQVADGQPGALTKRLRKVYLAFAQAADQ